MRRRRFALHKTSSINIRQPAYPSSSLSYPSISYFQLGKRVCTWENHDEDVDACGTRNGDDSDVIDPLFFVYGRELKLFVSLRNKSLQRRMKYEVQTNWVVTNAMKTHIYCSGSVVLHLLIDSFSNWVLYWMKSINFIKLSVRSSITHQTFHRHTFPNININLKLTIHQRAF